MITESATTTNASEAKILKKKSEKRMRYISGSLVCCFVECSLTCKITIVNKGKWVDVKSSLSLNVVNWGSKKVFYGVFPVGEKEVYFSVGKRGKNVGVLPCYLIFQKAYRKKHQISLILKQCIIKYFLYLGVVNIHKVT